MTVVSNGGNGWLTKLARKTMTQGILRELGYYRGHRDAWLGPKTREAIKAFQNDIPHLLATGKCDPDTWGMLCLAGEVYAEEPVVSYDGQWRPIPGAMLDDLDALVDACVKHKVSYGPGRGWFDEDTGTFVVTQGAFGLGGQHKSMDKVLKPAKVCTTWTYLVMAFLARVGPIYNEALGGGQPPIWDVIAAEPDVIHEWGRYGPFLGFRPYWRHWPGSGGTEARHPRARDTDMDLLEIWQAFEANPENVPEVMVGAWASAGRKGFHHTTMLRADRKRRQLRFVDAGGWRTKDRVFSGTDMDIGVIASMSDAVRDGQKGWGRWWGLHAGRELMHVYKRRPRYGFGLELQRGKVTVVQEAT